MTEDFTSDEELEKVKSAYAGSGLEAQVVLVHAGLEHLLNEQRARRAHLFSVSTVPEVHELLVNLAPHMRKMPFDLANYLLPVLVPLSACTAPAVGGWHGYPSFADNLFKSNMVYMFHPAVADRHRVEIFTEFVRCIAQFEPCSGDPCQHVSLVDQVLWRGVKPSDVQSYKSFLCSPWQLAKLQETVGRIPNVIQALEHTPSAYEHVAMVTAINKFPDNYVLYDELGHGAASEVYLAYNEDTEEDIALKIAKSDVSPAACRKDLARIRCLESPYIAKQYDPFRVDGKLVIPMEPFDTTLRQVIAGYKAENKTVLLTDALRWFEQMLIGLALCHQNGIIHQDLAPNNVGLKMVDGNYIVKLTDFNTGLYLSSEEPKQGPLDYSSSDMLRASLEGREYTITARDTCWSIGVMLYEMLTGRLLLSDDRLFEGKLPNRHNERELYKQKLFDRQMILRSDKSQMLAKVVPNLSRVMLAFRACLEDFHLVVESDITVDNAIFFSDYWRTRDKLPTQLPCESVISADPYLLKHPFHNVLLLIYWADKYQQEQMK